MDNVMSIKAVIFDVDGVLVAPTDHYKYLNMALKEYGFFLTEEEFYQFNAMPSLTKLKWLTKEKSLPVEFYDGIMERKYVLQNKNTTLHINPNAKKIMQELKASGIKLGMVSNAKRVFINRVINEMGIIDLIDHFISVEDDGVPKPSPYMYNKMMEVLGILPEETIIVEDSEPGKEAASASQANVYEVDNWQELDDNLLSMVAILNKRIPIHYTNKKLNIVIPMAGLGSRFTEQGFDLPKPLIPVMEKPMIERVVENLNIDANYIFIVQKEHVENYQVDEKLRAIIKDCEIIEIDGLTEGAACTVLKASKLINNTNPLLVCNSDQIIDWNARETMLNIENSNMDGTIFCFNDNDKKWSFAKVENNVVVEVAEKQPISNNATTGHYYWRHGSDFVTAANKMIDNDDRTNNEFYVAPAFNYAIKDGLEFDIITVDAMHGVGTPEDLEKYVNHITSR